MTYPFTKRKNVKTSDISSSPILIFGNDQYTCRIESIIVTNTSEPDEECIVTLYCLPDVQQTLRDRQFTPDSLSDQDGSHMVKSHIVIPPYGMVDVLSHTFLNMEPGDILFAYSNAAFSTFNTWINYSEFQQLT